MEQTLVGIDVGTTKICTLVAQVGEDNSVQVIGVGIAPARGLLKGVVTDIQEASEAIGESIRRAERVSGVTITDAYVSVGGSHISSQNSRGVIAIGRGERPIDRGDIQRAREAAEAITVPHNRRIIHCIPREYIIDGQPRIRNPLGLMGYRLEVDAHMVTGAATSIQNLIHCLELRKVRVLDLVLQPLASAEAVLTEEERKMGVALIDIGGGTTDLAMFVDGMVWETSVLAVGGNHVTNDLAVGLRTPWPSAEEAKVRFAHALPESIDESEVIELATFGSDSMRTISRRELCSITNLRVDEIFEIISREIKRSSMESFLAAGAVITGGTANLRAIADVAQRRLSMPVRIGTPKRLRGLVEAISGPAYATSVGLLLWALEHEATLLPHEGPNELPLVQRVLKYLRLLLPQG